MTNSGGGVGNSSARRSPTLVLFGVVLVMVGIGVASGYALGSLLL